MATLHDEAYPMPTDPRDWDHDTELQNAEMARLQAISDALGDDKIVGGLLMWPRGDGYAVYLVTCARPLVVQWVPYMDNWQVEPELIEGLTRKSIKEKLHGHRALRRLFGAAQQAQE